MAYKKRVNLEIVKFCMVVTNSCFWLVDQGNELFHRYLNNFRISIVVLGGQYEYKRVCIKIIISQYEVTISSLLVSVREVSYRIKTVIRRNRQCYFESS